MNILFVCPYMPTLVRTRSSNLVRTLVRRGHSVTLATVWENDAERSAIDGWTKSGVRVIAEQLPRARSVMNLPRALLRGQPLQSVYSWQPALARRLVLETSISKWDVVHVEHLRGAEYGLHLNKIKRRQKLPIVWDSVDCISYLFEQAARTSRNLFGQFVTRFELAPTRRYERKLLQRFERVLVTSPQDRNAFLELSQSTTTPREGNPIQVLSNGVDLNYFQPMNQTRHSKSIIFTGKMSYHANVTAALYLVNKVMPLVWQNDPAVRVQIVGQNPTRAVRDLADANPQRVEVTGAVADIRPYLAKATIAVAPLLYGAGIQNKVLEAMAMATPVVASARAVAALSTQPNHDVLVGDDAETLVQHIIRLLADEALRERLGKEGRCYVERNHDWNQIGAQLEQVYRQVITAE